MRYIFSPIFAMFTLCLSCSPQREDDTSVPAQENAIIQTLSIRSRNAVHVALWTLQKNGITDFEPISFDAPYSKVQPKINDVCELLKGLPEARLNALDQSLAYHWKIYSPIWSSNDWP